MAKMKINAPEGTINVRDPSTGEMHHYKDGASVDVPDHLAQMAKSQGWAKSLKSDTTDSKPKVKHATR